MKKKIGIICAVESEVKPYLDSLTDVFVSQKAKLNIYEGKLENQSVVTLFSGVCKVNAAIASQILIDKHNVDCIIVSGTAGGIDRRLKIGDTVVSTQVAYHDVAHEILTEYHPWMKDNYFYADEKLLSQCNNVAKTNDFSQEVYFGKIVTGEKFIDQHGRKEINNKYSPLCVDMESAAIAHVCYTNDIPFIIIRSISDVEDKSGPQSFFENCKYASENSYSFVRALLKHLEFVKNLI